MPPLSPSNRCLFRGPPPPSLGPQPPPPNSAFSADWCPACQGRGPRALTSPTEGGRRLREGGDGPRLSTSESSLPGLVLLWNRRRGRVPGGRAREQRQGDGRSGIEGPRRAEGPAVIRRGDRGARRGGGAAGGGSSGRTSGWKRALSRPPWLWGCPPRKRLPAMWPWSVGT